MRKQQEEIQKIRSQRTFRSQPIKHYNAVEIKPSNKPLTEAKSPNIGSLKPSNLSTASSSSNISNDHVAVIKGNRSNYDSLKFFKSKILGYYNKFNNK